MTYTDKAKKWLSENHAYTCKAILAFASFLDVEEERVRCQRCQNFIEPHHWAIGQRGQFWHRKCHELTMTEDENPRKEEKPVCEGDVFTCPDGFNCTHAKPKPEPIEEWVDPFDYDWSNDPERDFRRIAGVLVDIGKRLNAVCRRLNTITK